MLNRLFYARFNDRTFSNSPRLYHTSLGGGWKFVGASYDNETGEFKLWADGALKQTRNMGAGVELATQGNVRLGVREKANNWYFKGKISQLQIYNEALSQQQILKLATKPKGEKNLVQVTFRVTTRDQLLKTWSAQTVGLEVSKLIRFYGTQRWLAIMMLRDTRAR